MKFEHFKALSFNDFCSKSINFTYVLRVYAAYRNRSILEQNVFLPLAIIDSSILYKTVNYVNYNFLLTGQILFWFFYRCSPLHIIWGWLCQKQVSHAGISNYLPQFTVGCNYLSLPEIPASDIKVLIYGWLTAALQKLHWYYEINEWISNHITCLIWDVIFHSCPNIKGSLTHLPLVLHICISELGQHWSR